ncbi:MAG: hypothetical protein EOP66_17735 [Sphingomonas sp.]|nr:MAG: hypothetical protein EOP66_17735 [Sphingomonas sp.]
MTIDPRYEDSSDVEEIAELGMFERRHRKVARSLGVSNRSLGLLWIATVFFLIGVAAIVWMSLR